MRRIAALACLLATATLLPVQAEAAKFRSGGRSSGSSATTSRSIIVVPGVAAGALLTTRLPVHSDRRHLLMACYGLQALGIALSVWWPSLAGFALGSLLLGLPFTAITLFAMQEARRLRPHNVSGLIGWLTAAYGLGQIAGPPMVAALLRHSATPAAGFTLSLQIAAGALLAGLLMLGWLARQHPLGPPP